MKSIAIAAALTCALASLPAKADVVMDWNAKADAIGVEKQLVNSANSRAQAMLHVAMFEAVNAIDKRYTPYKLSLAADHGTSREAAAAVAAHDVLIALYPDQKADLDTTLATSLSAIADGEAKSKGMELGKKAAAEIIALRAKDGSGAPENYRPQTSPGAYVPTVVPVEFDRRANHAMGDADGLAVPACCAAGTHIRCLDKGPQRNPRISAASTAPSAAPSRPRSGASGSSRVRGPTTRSFARSRRAGTWTSWTVRGSMR